MTWTIVGVDRESGMAVLVEVEADSLKGAQMEARKRRIVVDRIEPSDPSSIPSVQEDSDAKFDFSGVDAHGVEVTGTASGGTREEIRDGLEREGITVTSLVPARGESAATAWYGKMRCLKCGHNWQARNDTPSARCPKCGAKSPSPLHEKPRSAGCLGAALMLVAAVAIVAFSLR